MSMLTEREYEEYIQLLRVWVDAERALEGPAEADGQATQRSREAHAAVQSFRQRYGLGEAAVGAAAEAQAVRRR